jgi:hypothetical protein
MFHFQTLDVYKCAVAFLPIGYALAGLGDGEMASQLRRAALSINLDIAESTGRFGKDERRFLVTAHAVRHLSAPPSSMRCRSSASTIQECRTASLFWFASSRC